MTTAEPSNGQTEPTEETQEIDLTSDLLDQVDLEVTRRIDGILIGTLVRVEDSTPYVVFPGSPDEVAAQTTVPVNGDEEDRQVALSFLQGNPHQPLILGFIQNPRPLKRQPLEAGVDGRRVLLEAEKEIVLKCGKASITLTSEGRIILKGTNLLSRSSGANKIKGAYVSIN